MTMDSGRVPWIWWSLHCIYVLTELFYLAHKLVDLYPDKAVSIVQSLLYLIADILVLKDGYFTVEWLYLGVVLLKTHKHME